MPIIHKNLAESGWAKLNLTQQLANIGAEFSRWQAWRNKNLEFEKRSQARLLELLDLTIADPRFSLRLKELTRLREIICEDKYSAVLKSYFLSFALAARK